jgi:hypothetical protein
MSPCSGVVSLGSSTDSVTSEEAEDYEEDTLAREVKQIFKTAHKLKEESGEYPVEPLLKENPNRFVLFPIQDDEVRMYRRCNTPEPSINSDNFLT